MIGRRILDGVNALMSRISADDTPLSGVDEAALAAELEARAAVRASGTTAPRDNPRVKHVGASAEARVARKRAADDRNARIRGERSRREAAERAARERAMRDAEAELRRKAGVGGAGPAPGPRPSAGQRPPPRPRSPGQADKIAEYYKTLDLPVGSSLEEIKAAHRKLMRKYHPDRHVGSPQKQKAANELSMRVNEAYAALEKYLLGEND